LSTVAFCLLIGSTGRSVELKKPGLVGAWFGEADLTDCRDAMLIKNLEQKWDESDDHGRVWSAKWQGFVVGPATIWEGSQNTKNSVLGPDPDLVSKKGSKK
jgi:hypothetical protein